MIDAPQIPAITKRPDREPRTVRIMKLCVFTGTNEWLFSQALLLVEPFLHRSAAASAAMTLDVYSDLFSDDLDAVATALDAAASAQVVG